MTNEFDETDIKIEELEARRFLYRTVCNLEAICESSSSIEYGGYRR